MPPGCRLDRMRRGKPRQKYGLWRNAGLACALKRGLASAALGGFERGVDDVGDSKDLRKRLDALNRQALPERQGSGADVEGIRRKLRRHARQDRPRPPESIVYRRDIPRSEVAEERPRVRSGRHVVLEDAVGGVEVRVLDGGRAYVIVEPLNKHGDAWEPFCSTLRDGLLNERSSLQQRISAACGSVCSRPEDVMFMDLESTGLAGTPLFLIGVMVWAEQGLVVRQYFARDYSEERAVISLFLQHLAEHKLLVTFNGKSFDLPYVRVRAAATGIPFVADAAHFDLLHECRRVWGRVLPDCRLQTLESRICGRARHSDIPGNEIPAAYHEFVRTQNAVEIVEILRHNVLDLATLAELMVKLPALA